MRSLVCRLLSAPLIIALLGAASPVIAASPPPAAASPTPTASWAPVPAWAQPAVPYVHVSNYVATIDPAISSALDPALVARVQEAVAAYNALPLAVRSRDNNPDGSLRLHLVARSSGPAPAADGGGGGRSCAYAYTGENWFGWSLYLSHCATQQIEGVIAGGLGAAGVGALICAIATDGFCAPWAGGYYAALGGVLGSLLWAITNADHGNGVWINFYGYSFIPVSVTTG